MFMFYVCVYVHECVNTMWFFKNESVYKSSINVMESMLDHPAKGKHVVILFQNVVGSML